MGLGTSARAAPAFAVPVGQPGSRPSPPPRAAAAAAARRPPTAVARRPPEAAARRPPAAAARPPAAAAAAAAALAAARLAAGRGRGRRAARRSSAGTEAPRPVPRHLLRHLGLEVLVGAGLVAGGGTAGAAGGGKPVDLRGRSACVTGASRGIGKGIAIALGEAGATVFVTGRRQEAIAKTAELATKAGGQGVPILCDHAKDDQVQRAFAEIGERTGGSLDVLVNNAFQDPAQKDSQTDKLLEGGAKFYQLPLQVWDDVHRVGLRSHYVSSYYAAPLLLKAATPEWRPLLAVTSAPAAVTYYYATAYGVSKAAGDRLVRDLQVELGPQGVDCVSFWPGVVYTEFVQKLYETGDVERINRVTGGADPNLVCESPLLTGRVITRLAADPAVRKPPYVSAEGLSGRICVVAEGARDLGLRDGGLPGSVAGELYGPDREPAASIRSLGFLAPNFIKEKLPSPLKWLAEPTGPLANKDLRVPFDLMAKDPRTEDPRKQDMNDFVAILNGGTTAAT